MQLAFDSWDLTPVVLPVRSRLHSIEPIGVGTPFVESLTGYIMVVTAALVHCLAKARGVADAELNALDQNIRAKLDASEVQQFVTAERLWMQYRDANCVAERDLYGGGTASGPAYLGCLEAMTRKRAKELTVTYAVRLK